LNFKIGTALPWLAWLKIGAQRIQAKSGPCCAASDDAVLKLQWRVV
jgi:hypothetical protein